MLGSKSRRAGRALREHDRRQAVAANLFRSLAWRRVGDDRMQYMVSPAAQLVVSTYLDTGSYDAARLGAARSALLEGIDLAVTRGVDRTDVCHMGRLMVQALGAVESGDPMRAGELALYSTWTPAQPLVTPSPLLAQLPPVEGNPHA